MPKSKRARIVHLTQVSKKTREHKDKLFEAIRAVVPNYEYIMVLSVENVRNIHLRELRSELSDSRCVYLSGYLSTIYRLPICHLLAAGLLLLSFSLPVSLSPARSCVLLPPAASSAAFATCRLSYRLQKRSYFPHPPFPSPPPSLQDS